MRDTSGFSKPTLRNANLQVTSIKKKFLKKKAGIKKKILKKKRERPKTNKCGKKKYYIFKNI